MVIPTFKKKKFPFLFDSLHVHVTVASNSGVCNTCKNILRKVFTGIKCLQVMEWGPGGVY